MIAKDLGRGPRWNKYF